MSSRRIILNSSATYFRSILTVGLGLFSSRWIFTALGVSDYGLFAVVGSIIPFITILNGVMSGSAARHFGFAIGHGDVIETQKYFNTALCIHLILPVILILIGWPIGEYCICHVFTIPPDRIAISLWVFRLSLSVAFFGMVSIPYLSMFYSKQNIAELAVWGMVQSVVMFGFAYILTKVKGDRLLFFTVYSVAIGILFQVVQVMRASYIFPECRINCRQWFDKSRFKTILSFASWTFFGAVADIVRSNGAVILLNIRFGPNINAAFAIGNQVSNHASYMGVAMLGAISPEIMATEGRGDRSRMLAIAQSANKFVTILLLLLAIPIVIEIDSILDLWLVAPPQYAGLFCQLLLLSFILDKCSCGSFLSFYAYGKIAIYQAIYGGILLLSLPLSWAFLKLGAAPTSVGIAFVITMIAVSAWRVFYAQRLFGEPVRDWLSEVALPCSIVTLASGSAGIAVHCSMPSSFSRLALVVAVSIATTLATSWLVAINKNERMWVKINLRLFLDKISSQ